MSAAMLLCGAFVPSTTPLPSTGERRPVVGIYPTVGALFSSYYDIPSLHRAFCLLLGPFYVPFVSYGLLCPPICYRMPSFARIIYK